MILKSSAAKQMEEKIEQFQQAATVELELSATMTAALEATIAGALKATNPADSNNVAESSSSSEDATMKNDPPAVVDYVGRGELNATNEVVKSDGNGTLEIKKISAAIIAGEKEKVLGVETFSTKSGKTIEDGVHILRSLGNGKYEAINLKKIPLKDLLSEGAGLGLDQDLDRANAFFHPSYQWVSFIEKCALVARYSDRHIFQFPKLPTELRVIIYTLVAVSAGVVGSRRPNGHWGLRGSGSSCVKVLHICQWIRAEAKDYFFQNMFELQDHYGNIQRALPPSIGNYIREMTYRWDGRVKEVQWISSLSKLNSLRVLHIAFATELGTRHQFPPAKPQKLYTDVENIKRFSIAHGFDKLAQIRGLERVTFSSQVYQDDPTTLADAKAFEVFLNQTLTLPKPPPAIKKARKSRAKKTAVLPAPSAQEPAS